MRLKKLRANAKCPCGSGKKHKQCCATDHPWFESDEGHIVPQGVARDFKDLYHVRDELVRIAGETGALSKLGPADTSYDLFGLLDRDSVVDLMASLGFDSSIALYFERTGGLPPLERWKCWLQTGEWVTAVPMSFEDQERVAKVLHEVIDCYAPRSRNDDGSACHFVCRDMIARKGDRYFGLNFSDLEGMKEQGYDVHIVEQL